MARLSKTQSRTRRIDANSLRERSRQGQMPPGVVVIVIEPGVYNNENHRANPKAEVGDVITVAAGGYYEALLKKGKVSPFEQDSFSDAELADEELVEEVDAAETAKEIASEEASRRAPRWQDLKAQAGITDTSAKALYAAGVQTKGHVQVIMRMGDEGRRQLTNLKGVGDKTVDTLFAWAEEEDG